MSFGWTAYLDLAAELANGGSEAKWRSSVSRAYYSAFCTARDWLLQHDKAFTMPTQGNSHDAVWSRFNQAQERLKRQVANTGFRLRGIRVDADYKHQAPAFKDDREAKATLEQARRILKLLQEMAPARD